MRTSESANQNLTLRTFVINLVVHIRQKEKTERKGLVKACLQFFLLMDVNESIS